MAQRLLRLPAEQFFTGSSPVLRFLFKMAKVYLIHGWGGSSKDAFFPWIEEELKKREFEVKSFDMPNTNEPKIEDWVLYLEKNIQEVGEQTYFIGHSIGCQTIMRFLEKLHKHQKIAGCVFVAPWFDLINLQPEEMAIAHPWINSKINSERVLDHCNNFLTIFSNNDPYVSLDEFKKFESKLNSKTLIKKNLGHFDEVKQIPEILEFVK